MAASGSGSSHTVNLPVAAKKEWQALMKKKAWS